MRKGDLMKSNFILILTAFLLLASATANYSNARIGCLYWGFEWPGAAWKVAADVRRLKLDGD